MGCLAERETSGPAERNGCSDGGTTEIHLKTVRQRSEEQLNGDCNQQRSAVTEEKLTLKGPGNV